jgi:hypothetical protein
MARFIIGIDTGSHTGLAVWDSADGRLVEVATLNLPAALKVVERYHAEGGAVIVIEDARLRTWIPRSPSLSRTIGRAQGAGSVKRDAAIWCDFAKNEDIPIICVPPSKGMTKWSAETFQAVTGWKGRTSNHSRDAAMLVFGGRVMYGQK